MDNLPERPRLDSCSVSDSSSVDITEVTVNEDEITEEMVDDPPPISSQLGNKMASSAAASLPYLGPTGRCKMVKKDETTQLFKETLLNLNKSVPAPTPLDTDTLIGQNVTLSLRNIKNVAVRLQYRKKFRELLQECEETVLMEESFVDQ